MLPRRTSDEASESPVKASTSQDRSSVGAGHLWAIGYEDMQRAEQVRAEIARLSERHCLILLDTAVVVRYPDGSVTLDGEPFVGMQTRSASSRATASFV